MPTKPSLADFRGRFPEFSADDAPDAKVLSVLSTADLFVDPLVWGDDYPHAYLFYAAHMLALQQQLELAQAVGNSGMTDTYVSQARFEDRTISFAQRQGRSGGSPDAGPGEALLEQTLYGQMYLQLRTRNVFPIMVV